MLLSWRFLRIAALAYGIAMLLVWLTWFGLLAGSKNGREHGGTGDVIGPDLPAFYTAGWILRHHETDALYNFRRQQQLQMQFFPDSDAFHSGVSAFINPPHYAWLMQPLSTLPYPAAFIVWTLFQVGCLAAALALLRALLPGLRSPRGTLLIVLAGLSAPVCFFSPMARIPASLCCCIAPCALPCRVAAMALPERLSPPDYSSHSCF